MTESTTSHDPWEQLAVGHALDALEPADEAALLTHLPGCPACRRSFESARAAMADLAHGTEPAEPPPALWNELREAAWWERPPGGSGRDPESAAGPWWRGLGLQERRTERFWVRRPWARTLLVVAAVAALLAAGGYAVSLQGLANVRRTQLNALLSCLSDSGCRSVALYPTQAGPRDAYAVALVRGRQLQLVVQGLVPNNPTTQAYVLWQVQPGSPPVLEATFGVSTDGLSVLNAGTLKAALSSSAALAISREKTSRAPTIPGTPLLEGAVTS